MPRVGPVRVAHLGKYYPPAVGGIETHLRTLARSLADSGADVRVLAVRHTPGSDADAEDGPVRVRRVARLASVARFDVCPGLPAAVRELARWRPDVWHLHAPNPAMTLAVLGCPTVRPLVVTHHADALGPVPLRPLFRPVELGVYRRSAVVLTTHPHAADGSPLLVRFRRKLVTVPLGIDLRPFREPSATAREYAAALRAKAGGPLWACVGRLARYKGIDVALRALRDVPGRLIAVGAGPMLDPWQRLARELGVAERVDWLGPLSDDERTGVLLTATALWFPSVTAAEGFGLAQVEAMAAGCPVVNTALPGSGVPWVCRDGVAGLTVPPNDPAALASAARRLLADPGLRDRLADGAQREAERFDHRDSADRTLAVYRQVIR